MEPMLRDRYQHSGSRSPVSGGLAQRYPRSTGSRARGVRPRSVRDDLRLLRSMPLFLSLV